MTTVFDLLSQDPTNVVVNEGHVTQTDKEWARNYHPIQNLIVHTYVGSDNWSDCELWFHTEISNIVLAAWNEYGQVKQTSHTKPPSGNNIAEEVDATYLIAYGNAKVVLAIGEMKRNLIRRNLWQRGNISSLSSQKLLSRELRGYAHKYQSPQVYCFDGETLLLLQFRAAKVENIRDAGCLVDCWVIPRKGSAVTMRYALYRLLVQGFRRFQGMCAVPTTVGGLMPHSRMFFNGCLVWRADGASTNTNEHPGGYQRVPDADTGAIKWTHPESDDLVWETPALWGEYSQQ